MAQSSVLLLGNMGNGKSTTCNKLAGQEDAFDAKMGTMSATKGVNSAEFEEMGLRLIDT